MRRKSDAAPDLVCAGVAALVADTDGGILVGARERSGSAAAPTCVQVRGCAAWQIYNFLVFIHEGKIRKYL